MFLMALSPSPIYRCATKAGGGWLSSGHGSVGNLCGNLDKKIRLAKQQTDDTTILIKRGVWFDTRKIT